MSPLQPKQRKFVEVYVATLNVTEAARQAGYKFPGVNGHKLLKKPQVKRAITLKMKKINAEIAVSLEEALWQLNAALTRNLLDFVDETTGKIDFDKMGDWTPEMGAAIDAIKQTIRYDDDGNPIYENELKFVPKLPAVKMALEYLGVLNKDNRPTEQPKTQVDWDAYYVKQAQERAAALEDDPVEKKIKSLTHDSKD